MERIRQRIIKTRTVNQGDENGGGLCVCVPLVAMATRQDFCGGFTLTR